MDCNDIVICEAKLEEENVVRTTASGRTFKLYPVCFLYFNAYQHMSQRGLYRRNKRIQIDSVYLCFLGKILKCLVFPILSPGNPM